MSLPNPKPVSPKSSTYTNEPATATSFSDLQRFFAPLILKVSRVSPPGTTDVKELQFTFDKTTKKLWLKSDGAMYSVQFS